MGEGPADDEAMIARVLDVYEALGRRDLAALQRQISLDVTLHVGGAGRFAGTYRGMGAVMALGTKIEDRLIPGESELHEIGVSGDVVRAEVTVRIPVRGQAEPFRARLVERFGFEPNGRINEIWLEATDPDEVHRFLWR
jgi:hypothetical protein